MVSIKILPRSSLVVPSQNLPEYFIVELQGSLQAEVEHVNSVDIGTLYVHPELRENSEAKLHIGQHQLYGRVEKLKRPLAYAVAEKFQPATQMDTDQTPSGGGAYRIVHIIRHKVIFKDRPHLVIQT
ncbi:hypothetical protein IWQ61_004253 [Dispira simplex]|nr:hypothetical protein IWQ61_004253 [Dispira simplex]